MNARCNLRTGMTLLEVTLSLGLLSLLLLPTVGMLQVAQQLWHHSESEHRLTMQRAAIIRYARNRMQRIETIKSLTKDRLEVENLDGSLDIWISTPKGVRHVQDSTLAILPYASEFVFEQVQEGRGSSSSTLLIIKMSFANPGLEPFVMKVCVSP